MDEPSRNHGTGPVLLLAGAPADASVFAPIVPLLATDHTVVTYDPRGIAWPTTCTSLPNVDFRSVITK